MTLEEIARFFAAEDDAEFRLRWMLYFRTGLRASAGINAEWEWILWRERALLLPAKANKSGMDHWIPLDRALISALGARRRSLAKGSAGGPIFAPATVKQVRARFLKICKKAGIDTDGLCLHSIRHTYATGAFEASGFNVKVVQKLLCHANAATTMKYIHTSEQELRSATEEFGARLFRDGA
jgi:integrase